MVRVDPRVKAGERMIIVPPDPEKLSESVTVSLTPSMKLKLQAKANQLGVSMSSLVRGWISEHLR